MFSNNLLMGAAGSGGARFQVDAADFDGSVYGDYASTPTGLVDGQKVTASFWFKTDGNGTEDTIYNGTPNGDFHIRHGSDNKMSFYGATSSYSNIMVTKSGTTQTVADGWTHWYLAADLGATTVEIYKNGSDDNPTLTTVSNSTIDFAEPGAHVMANHTAGSIASGDLAEFWMHTDYYAASTYVSSFISGGYPVDLGSDGSTPTGVQPLFYYHLDVDEAAANFFTNAGTAGDPTAEGGTLSTASTSPSD